MQLSSKVARTWIPVAKNGVRASSVGFHSFWSNCATVFWFSKAVSFIRDTLKLCVGSWNLNHGWVSPTIYNHITHIPVSTDFHFQCGTGFYSYCSFWGATPQSGRFWQNALLFFSHPNMLKVRLFLHWCCYLSEILWLFTLIFNYITVPCCLWSPCLI